MIDYEDGYITGPPTLADDAWFQSNVVSRGYPKVRRGDTPLTGQTTLEDFLL